MTAYAKARWMIGRQDLRSAVARLRDAELPEDPGAPVGPGPESARVASAVRRVLGPLPLDSRCLSQSLVVSRMLAKRGIPSRLVIGVRSGDDFLAHAWVELDGSPILPTGGGEFERLLEL